MHAVMPRIWLYFFKVSFCSVRSPRPSAASKSITAVPSSYSSVCLHTRGRHLPPYPQPSLVNKLLSHFTKIPKFCLLYFCCHLITTYWWTLQRTHMQLASWLLPAHGGVVAHLSIKATLCLDNTCHISEKTSTNKNGPQSMNEWGCKIEMRIKLQSDYISAD